MCSQIEKWSKEGDVNLRRGQVKPKGVSRERVRDCGVNLITFRGSKRSWIGRDIGASLLDLVLNKNGLGEKTTENGTVCTGESAGLGGQGCHSASFCVKRVDDGSDIASNNGRGKNGCEESAEEEDNILEAEHFEVRLRKRMTLKGKL